MAILESGRRQRPQPRAGEAVTIERLGTGFRVDFATVDAKGRPVIIARHHFEDVATARVIAGAIQRGTNLPIIDKTGCPE